MKKSIFFGLMLSSVAHAADERVNDRPIDRSIETAKVKAQVRLDHTTMERQQADTFKSTSGFVLQRARLVFEGSVDKSLSYKFKADFDRAHLEPVGAANANDGVSRLLREGKVMHKVLDGLTLEIGRMEVNTMSVEGYYSSMDSYSASQLLIYRKPDSSNGVAAVADFANQKVTLQVLNSPGYNLAKSTAATKYATENDDMTATFYYQGKFADGMLLPILSYANIARHDFDSDKGLKSGKYNQQIFGAGTTLVLGDLTVEAEYDLFKNPSYNKYVDSNLKTGQVDASAVIASLRYKIPAINTLGILKYAKDYETFAETSSLGSDFPASDKVSADTFNAAIEFRPNAGKIRYHGSFEKLLKVFSKDGSENILRNQNTYLIGAAATI